MAMTPASGRSRTGTAAPTPEGAKLEAAPGASRGRDGAARHRTHAGDEDRADPQKHELATATATPSPPRHGFRGGQRRRACALELERSGGVTAPGTPTSPAPSSSALPRRGWPDPAASSSARGGGSWIWWPRRPATAVAAPSSSSGAARFGASSSLLPGRRPWQVPARGHGGEQIPGKRRGGAAVAAPPGAVAEQERGRPARHGSMG